MARDWRVRATKHRVAVALVAIVTAVALVLSLAQAGRQYFYCKAMGVLASDPCSAATPSHKTTSDELQQTHTDCCKVIKMPPVQQGALARVDSIADAPLTTVVAPAVLSDRDRTATILRSAHVRWRPPSQPSTRLHTRIMVFLT